jgi:hypothetical protein
MLVLVLYTFVGRSVPAVVVEAVKREREQQTWTLGSWLHSFRPDLQTCLLTHALYMRANSYVFFYS